MQGIADLIIRPGMINVDFADVRTVMSEMGMAMMGTGRASGDSRARDAAEAAIRSPLLEDIDLHGARGVLVNITAGPDLSIGEFSDVGETINDFTSERGLVVVGTVIDAEAGDELRVTVVATGLGEANRPNIVVDNTPAVAAIGRERDIYAELDRPTVMRQQAAREQEPEAAAEVDTSESRLPRHPGLLAAPGRLARCNTLQPGIVGVRYERCSARIRWHAHVQSGREDRLGAGLQKAAYRQGEQDTK